ncbi:type I-C CRISPR-associated protein Cas7/Csd2 [Trichlorobacter ammonificans]|uniref:CRISPR-associated protein n=1 Tax=Trichlorobacter ammonificans TaxID=2916410 RepID=A0ABN8HHT5_9BACT|nr:type I-C CRISPR-associated protein Cas7/Csd2 [Trichlorobacter ammonificans]CAH2030725.1 CRISPR-associated protein [Trichlorobacter ammonificans]
MSLTKKIDFAVVFKVVNANPNGDPLNGNRPRTIYEGNGEVSDVCIKRKIRNRLMEAGKPIFVQSDDSKNDSHPSLKSRADAVLSGIKAPDDIAKRACETWFDVRTFGQLFAFKATGSKKGKAKEGEESGDDKGVSIGIRGPVSIQSAFSKSPVSLTSTQITKSVSSEGDGTKRGSDTMGMKHRVDRGIYTFYGSMNPQLAVKTGFSDDDADAIKAVLPKLFENDASSARPEGSMEVLKVVWWEHTGSKNGLASSAKVHRSLTVNDDGEISFEPGKGPSDAVENWPKPVVIDGH